MKESAALYDIALRCAPDGDAEALLLDTDRGFSAAL